MKSNTVYKNRYDSTWVWKPINETSYLFDMAEKDMLWCRMGQTQDGFIHFFDPSGGPYIGIGGTIDGKPITRIIPTKEGYVAEVQDHKEE